VKPVPLAREGVDDGVMGELVSSDRSSWREGSVAAGLGPLAVVLVSSLTSSVRDDVGSTNVALLLAVIVVVAGLSGRLAGVTTSLTAAACFNFFHTAPFHSLRIADGRDVTTVCLLACIGVIVSAIGEWRRRTRDASERRLHGVRALEEVAASLAVDDATDDVWTTVRRVLVDELHLADCRFEPGPSTGHVVLPRSGALVARSMTATAQGFAMPAEGLAIPVVAGGATAGHIVMIPAPHTGSTHDSRRLAIALADQYAVALRLNQPDSARVHTA
jgi:K+-sensing histidine kinase KdpD